mmetsp:Transcript_26631/g.37514  ORF Transcript_26631/g.37514 Transcript_26631/m.37514 type:complete len:118 (+) Transcript_26631:62-415(+)
MYKQVCVEIVDKKINQFHHFNLEAIWSLPRFIRRAFKIKLRNSAFMAGGGFGHTKSAPLLRSLSSSSSSWLETPISNGFDDVSESSRRFLLDPLKIFSKLDPDKSAWFLSGRPAFDV